MASDMIFIACSFNGTLTTGRNNEPLYEGGIKKALMISKTCNYEGLLNEIYRITKIDPHNYSVKVICNWPVTAHRTTVVVISDDHDMSLMLALSEKQITIELFIEKVQFSAAETSRPQGEYSRMLDLEEDSTGFFPNQYETDWAQNDYYHLSGPSNVGTSSVPNVQDEGAEDDDDGPQSGDGSEGDSRVDSMQCVVQDVDDTIGWVDEAYVNNEYVEFEDPPPDEFQDEEWIQASTMEPVNIGGSVNEDATFKVGDLFESKAELIHAICEYSVSSNVQFKQVKSNQTSYNVICALNTERASKQDTGPAQNSKCPWKLFSHVEKRTSGQFKITQYCGVHTCSNHVLQLDSKHASAAYICKLIMPRLRAELDLRRRGGSHDVWRRGGSHDVWRRGGRSRQCQRRYGGGRGEEDE